MTQAIIDFFRNLLGNDIATIIVISMVPIIELRGAIPFAILMGMNPFQALWWSWLGSALVSPILLLLLQPILNLMKKTKIFRSFALAIESGFQGKATKVMNKNVATNPKIIERKKMLGTLTFVAVPLPLTGVWTGSAVAVFLGLSFWKSLAMVWIGNLVAGIIVTILSYFFSAYMDMILTIFLIIVLIILASYIVTVVVKMQVAKKKSKMNTQSNEQVDTANEAVVANNDESVADEIVEENIDNSVSKDSAEGVEIERQTIASSEILNTKVSENKKDKK